MNFLKLISPMTSMRVSRAVCSRHHHLPCISSLRTLLSSSYSCELQWEKRLNNELLSKISPDAFFSDLSLRYVKKMKVGAVDIDMFANVVTRGDQLEELQNLLYRLRKSRRTKDTLESTHHAVCRAFLRFNAGDRLLKLLLDRIGCGIFPDQYCYNMIMDYFIERKEFKNAAQVASLMMLQEDSGNEISRILAFYSLHMCLRDAQDDVTPLDDEAEKSKEEVKNEDEDEDEIQYIRVPYVRNYYFDDHFDLTDWNLICGKSLHFFAKQFDDIIGRSYQIIGLALFQKWEKCKQLLEAFGNSTHEKVILKAAVDKLQQIISEVPEENEQKDVAKELLEMIKQLENKGKISDEDLHDLMLEKVKSMKNYEAKDMEEMIKLFVSWDETRENALTQQLEEFAKEERIKEIEQKKKSIAEKERLLFFFENFTKHEMDFEEAEKQINELKSKTQVEEEYIPPQIPKMV